MRRVEPEEKSVNILLRHYRQGNALDMSVLLRNLQEDGCELRIKFHDREGKYLPYSITLI